MTELKRGSGGRLEDAFLAAKARNEAAFVAFVTAGFPTAEGEWVTLSWLFFCAEVLQANFPVEFIVFMIEFLNLESYLLQIHHLY